MEGMQMEHDKWSDLVFVLMTVSETIRPLHN